MQIRQATYRDAPAIRILLDTLGYKTSISLIINQLENMFGGKNDQVFVYELQKEVVGAIAIHYLPQLAVNGELVLISYLAVEDTMQGHGVGKALEEFVCQQALLRKCEQIQVHCSEWRVPAHKFYENQGYQDYPKYFTKRLVVENPSSDNKK